MDNIGRKVTDIEAFDPVQWDLEKLLAFVLCPMVFVSAAYMLFLTFIALMYDDSLSPDTRLVINVVQLMILIVMVWIYLLVRRVFKEWWVKNVNGFRFLVILKDGDIEYRQLDRSRHLSAIFTKIFETHQDSVAYLIVDTGRRSKIHIKEASINICFDRIGASGCRAYFKSYGLWVEGGYQNILATIRLYDRISGRHLPTTLEQAGQFEDLEIQRDSWRVIALTALTSLVGVGVTGLSQVESSKSSKAARELRRLADQGSKKVLDLLNRLPGSLEDKIRSYDLDHPEFDLHSYLVTLTQRGETAGSEQEVT